MNGYISQQHPLPLFTAFPPFASTQMTGIAQLLHTESKTCSQNHISSFTPSLPFRNAPNSFLHKTQQSDIKSHVCHTLDDDATRAKWPMYVPFRGCLLPLTYTFSHILFLQSSFFSWIFLADFCHRNLVSFLFSNLSRFRYFRFGYERFSSIFEMHAI